MTTAYAATASTATMSVSISGSNTVLETANYVFTFTVGTTVADTDYVAFTFPTSFFDRNATYAGTTCSPTCSVYILGGSNMIYVQPTSTNSFTGATTITIGNLINPSYSQSGLIEITGFTFVNRKKDKTYTFALTRVISPCQ